jgi:hypothetical protein
MFGESNPLNPNPTRRKDAPLHPPSFSPMFLPTFPVNELNKNLPLETRLIGSLNVSSFAQMRPQHPPLICPINSYIKPSSRHNSI